MKVHVETSTWITLQYNNNNKKMRHKKKEKKNKKNYTQDMIVSQIMIALMMQFSVTESVPRNLTFFHQPTLPMLVDRENPAVL
jgi:beta-xylosidase